MSNERRKKKRVPLKLNANIISAGKSYKGEIQEVSEQGLQYILNSLLEVASDFVPEKTSDLVLKDPSGKKYKLRCEVQWYLRGKGSDKSLTLGMKITDPTSKYKELIASLTTGKKK